MFRFIKLFSSIDRHERESGSVKMTCKQSLILRNENHMLCILSPGSIRSQSKDVRTSQSCNYGDGLKKHYFLVNGFGKLPRTHSHEHSSWSINFIQAVWPSEARTVNISEFLDWEPQKRRNESTKCSGSECESGNEVTLRGKRAVSVSAQHAPPDSHSEGFSWASARTDDLRPQTFALEDIEERIAWWDGPCGGTEGTLRTISCI